MSKAVTRLALAALAATLCATAAAQTTLEWIVLSPAGEEFTARMPKQPATTEQRLTGGGMYVVGKRYAADDAAPMSYVVWSLQNPDGELWQRLRAADATPGGGLAVSRYIDHAAELAWGLLVVPELERIKRETSWWERREAQERVGMAYVRAFDIDGKHAREYSVRLQNEGGHVYVCADGARVYVVAAYGPAEGGERLRQFVDSFAFKVEPPAPQVATGTGGGGGDGGATGPVFGGFGGPGGSAGIDYGRPFRQSEVSKKAVIRRQPEPGFTEEARRFKVTGACRLRAVLHSSGEVQHISVVKGLPHGLTEKALAAARQIRFEPAQKDGRAVSQYVALEYHFNVY